MSSSSNGDAIVESLPHEILLHIFTYLDCNDILNCQNVCRTWSNAALDTFLWQTKLCDLFSRRWSVISCERKSADAPDFSRITSTHPCEIYKFLFKYVPASLRTYDQNIPNPLASETASMDALDTSQTSPRSSISEQIISWFNRVVRRFSVATARRHSSTQQYRFAVFGPGFDQPQTSRLFSKLVDTRTKSFEPINMIPGRMGFGAGLTLRLYAQAQMAAYDDSLKCIFSHFSPNTTPVISRKPVVESSSVKKPEGSTQNSIHFENLEFDLHYLYSLRGHLSHSFDSQLERILYSRLFRHPSGSEYGSEAEALAKLAVTDSMQTILNGLNGIIYALDARETLEQSLCLRSELNAVLHGFPASIAKSVPIVILYIMPKEHISVKPFVRQTRRSISSGRSTSGAGVLNRDSYSGADYTISWSGSLLLPVSCLRLFELNNPWRLQKCASNDIKAVIQSIMWLRSMAPPIQGEVPLGLVRSNSTV
ncbi:unnamed protein product [Calicophoron daubneyi]|uniref:F-box domain-containing protein n=1 Tax=Calicophoron daubneyi TaxID=300641 RepID=A0AAV2U182_CALDB